MDPSPDALLDAFLRVHAQDSAVATALYARGVQLHGRLAADPPPTPAWGRFLVALGELAADHLHDDEAASRHFLAALESVRAHGDSAVAVAAGYNQAVLHERRGDEARALAAYRAAAGHGLDHGIIEPTTLLAGEGAARLAFARSEGLSAADRQLLKRTWLAWLHQRLQAERAPAADLDRRLGRTLAAFLLPEDDPGTLAAVWRGWLPHVIATAEGAWSDDHPACLAALFTAAAEAAADHLGDEGDDPGAPYRQLARAAQRSLPG
jgi:hypothetical protein